MNSYGYQSVFGNYAKNTLRKQNHIMSQEEIKKTLLDNLSNTEVLERYLSHLRETDLTAATNACLDLLKHGEETIRAETIWFIEMLQPKSPEVSENLRALICDENLYIRAHSIVYLAENNMATLTNELYDVMKEESLDSQTRARAAMALFASEKKDKIGLIREMLNDRNADIIWHGLYLLTKNSRLMNAEIRRNVLEIKNSAPQRTSSGTELNVMAEQVLLYL